MITNFHYCLNTIDQHGCRSVKSKIIVYILFIKLNKCITTYSTPLSIGINADILSVHDTVWQTNYVLEVSH